MDYASAISKVIPGTFVPDMGAATKASEAPNVTPIPGADAAQGPSFKDTLADAIGSVNDKLVASDQATRDLASGKTNDLNAVVTSSEEADLALNYAMAIRSKLLDAYTTVSQMQV